ncbi:isoleucine--tRNA ligase [Aminithiophilus ramosus]|uniref:Isoleucine--tRNA ligase n=1 Tax=Aminithiophilus ramosus TaxID=3029084 RepID=A0A9Q7AJ31_9BACT|nr:isoleucine--tRNA ligase [Aminithiophilus ramosus]QTX33724.1 isoleucine--tRNA ligase [Aminithiophilus ramosus]
MEYKETLNLPKTEFPMRANLAKREPAMLEYWNRSDIYGKLMERPAEKGTFVLHDGPPYANSNIHIGTAFNKVLKDFIPKYRWMKGYRAPYVPGWDTHGLPIELRVLKDENLNQDDLGPVELRRRCQAYAEKYLDVQRSEFMRLGVLGDWFRPYVTYEASYEAAQIGAFADMVERGLVYKGHKPVFWCIDCQTALAAAEIEYEDESSPSIYVAYPLAGTASLSPKLAEGVHVLIWTTTPWTLPASMAVALHADYRYGFYRMGEKICLMACDLASQVAEVTKENLGEPLHVCPGRDLEGLVARHPFYEERSIPLVLADYVTLDSGTGCVHTAPGHGVEDFETGIRYNIDIYNPVDDKGYFLSETALVGGLSLKEGEQKILATLMANGRLLGSAKILHSYPHCWRCKKPVIFRATEQWFVSVDAFREQTLSIIDNEVQWVPEWGHDRIANMVRDRSDWCISRQRTWGVPIPAFYCEKCGELILTSDRIRRVQAAVATGGADIWWTASPQELLGDLASCPHCGGTELRKERDIMDVWFDSGVSHLAVLETRPELHWPADLYLEGSDQHRGWFQTSLLTSVATRGKAPYKAVLTHGFIVDGEGKKMSKSIGNVVAPREVVDKYGADILRLWVASTDYRNDIRISETIIRNLTESYRRIRNTARYLLGNLYDFDPACDSLPLDEMEEMDRWILSKLQAVIEKATHGYDEYEFHVPTFAVHQFCVNELSAFYLDVSKDRLYAEGALSPARRSGQTAMWKILSALVRILAPVLSFTAEEIWQEMKRVDRTLPESVFLALWPEGSEERSLELEAKWEKILGLRGAFSRALEKFRSTGKIGQSLEACLSVSSGTLAPEIPDLLTEEEWATVAIVSQFRWSDTLAGDILVDEETGLNVAVSPAQGAKCPRCWKFDIHAGPEQPCPRCAAVLREAGLS